MTWFTGGDQGAWAIDRCAEVVGETLAPAARLAISGSPGAMQHATWTVRGVPSYERYVNEREQRDLAAISPPLGRPEATRAALIPIRKSDAWWALPADRRRAILEESSHHIATGMRLLPAVARRLYHCRDLGEPFDFLTWFEFAPEEAPRFESLVAELRLTEEWTYVVREVDIRLHL